MSVLSHSPSFNSSVASSQRSGIEDNKELITVKNYVKDLLRSRVFLGRYTERRLTDQRIGYRDIVVLSPAEVELKRDLLETKRKIMAVWPNVHWIGISDAGEVGMCPSGLCIWTEIDNQPLGPIWFQIKSIKFRQEEVIITLKCLRSITDAFLELEPILTSGTAKIYTNNNDIKELTSGASANIAESYRDIVENLKKALTISNIKEFVRFLFAFIIAIFTGSTAFINFLGNFVLALIRETSLLIKNSTPMFLGFLDFLSKIVGGFYILIAMFFKPNNPVPQNKRTLSYASHSRHSYHYDNGEFD